MFILGNAKKNNLSQKDRSNKYYLKDYSIDLSNGNDSHSIIVNNCLNYERILDVGCGVGYIGKKIKELKCVEIEGIEIDSVARKKALECYDKVYDFSVDDNTNTNYLKFINSKYKYDCIILADVIEHIVDPGAVINDLSKKLSSDGVMIVSVPNIAHVDIIKGLINQCFNYNETGILDSTHYRFFTENSFYDFINNVNKTYGLSFGAKRIGCTFAKNDCSDDTFIYDVIGDDIYKYQNIFLLSRLIKTKRYVVSNYYQTINQNYELLLKNRNDYDEKIKLLKKEIEDLEQSKNKEIDVLKSNLTSIINSRSWKVTKPLRKISAFLSDRGRKK